MISFSYDKESGIHPITVNGQIKFNPSALVCYILVGGTPAGIEGTIMLFSLEGTELKLYQGNIHDTGSSSLYNLSQILPELKPYFHSYSKAKDCIKKGWICIPYSLHGFYVFVPEFMGEYIKEIWKGHHGLSKDSRYILLNGIYSGCLKYEKKIRYMTGVETDDGINVSSLDYLREKEKSLKEKISNKKTRIRRLNMLIESLQMECNSLEESLSNVKQELCL